MKRILILFISLLMMMPVVATAQTEKTIFDFKLQVDGVFDKKLVKGDLNEYYIAPFEGETAHQLYTDVLSHIADINIPEHVTETVEDKTIIVNGSVTQITDFIDRYGNTAVASFAYSIELQFKDGKIRINEPALTLLQIENSTRNDMYRKNSYQMLEGITEILIDEKATNLINSYINTLISYIVYGMPGKSNDDW